MTRTFPTSPAAAQRLCDIKRYGIAAQGRAELNAHVKGKHLTRDKAIRAFCYDCMGYFEDGKADCKQIDCPLYRFMPYKMSNNVLAGLVQLLPEKNASVPDSSIIIPNAERYFAECKQVRQTCKMNQHDAPHSIE